VGLQRLFQDTIELIRNKGGFREVIVHYNNLEVYAIERQKAFATLFNRIRDFLQIPYTHFILVGNKQTTQLIQTIPQVSQIISDTAIVLPPFTEKELVKIIDKRMEALQIPGLTLVKPFDNSAISLLHKAYSGNIRAILNSLSTAIQNTVTKEAVTLNAGLTARTLGGIAEKRFLSKASPSGKKVLIEILKAGETTNKRISEKTEIRPQNVSKHFKELESTGAIFLSRLEGREKYYQVHPSVKWMNLHGFEEI